MHPEVQSVGATPADRERVIKYDMKDGDFAGELATPLATIPLPSHGVGNESDDASPAGKDHKPAWAVMLNQSSSVREGMGMLMDTAPAVYYTQGSRIQQMLGQRVGVPDEKIFTLNDFNMAPLDLTKPILLQGTSDAGKTEFALAHFSHPLIVRRRDDLKRLSFTTDGIIFDDCDFSKWMPEEIICLLSYNKTRSIQARYSDAWIEANLPIIFTTNKRASKFFPRGATSEQRKAITRRFDVVRVRGPLQLGGRPMTALELQQRRTAGTNGPQMPP